MGPAVRSSVVIRATVVGLVLVGIALALPLAAALRPLREHVASIGAAASAGSWGDEVSKVLRDFDCRVGSSFPYFLYNVQRTLF
jgi:transmembrane E3 ubiquitin-protein ligase